MRLKTVKMQGFTTFVRPVELDLEGLGAGVFAITGDNGEGKTTLMDAMGVGALYRNLPSRDPSGLADYADSKRGASDEVTFKAGGRTYRAVVGVKANGTQSAKLLLREKSGSWTPITSGKVRDYDEKIQEMFGPLRANLASVFGQQGGGGGFDSLKPAERKRLFRWYLGLDRVDAYHREVKDRLSGVDFAAVKQTRAAMQTVSKEAQRLKSENRVTARAVQKAEEELEGLREELQEALANAHLSEKASKLTEASEYAEELSDLEERLQAQLKTLDARRVDVSTEELEEELEKVEQLIEAAQDIVDIADKAIEGYNTHKGKCDDAARRTEVFGRVPCRVHDDCGGCEFLQEAGEAKAKLPSLKRMTKAAKKVARAAKGLADDQMEKVPELEDKEEQLELSIIHRKKQRQEQASVDLQRARVEEQLKAAQETFERTIELMDELEDGLPFDADGEVDYSQIPTMATVEARKKAVRDKEQMLEVLRDDNNRLASEAAAELARTDNLREALEKAEKAIEGYRPLQLLEEALGPNGFPIYEIDAAGPDVTAIINDLIEACYGERFRVAVRTMTPKKSGGFKEDFDFVVRDTRAHEDRTIGQMCGGEKTIIGEATRIGFALYQAQSTSGLRFETMFRDEAEGALSPNNAKRYVRMLARARDIGNFHQIFFVTHSEHAASSADRRLHIAKGKVRVTRLGAL